MSQTPSDTSKFINLKSNRSQLLHSFMDKFASQLSKTSKLNKSHSNLTLLFPNSHKTSSNYHKLFPSVDSHSSSKSFVNSFIIPNKSQISPKAFSPLRKLTRDFVDLGPYQHFLNEILSKDFDDKIRGFMENNDQNSFNLSQKNRFIMIKTLAENLIKEIEVFIAKAPVIGKSASFIDLLKLLNTDYCKIITNFISFLTLTPVLPQENKGKNEKKAQKLDLLSHFTLILEYFERIYCKNPLESPEVFAEISEKLEKMKLSLRLSDFVDSRAFSFITNLEEFIKSLYNIIEAQNSELLSQKSQILHYETLHEANYCLLLKSNTEEMLRKVLNHDTISQRKEIIKDRMDSLLVFTDKISALEVKLSQNSEEFERKDLIISQFESKVQELTREIAKNPQKISKETQASFYLPQKTINQIDDTSKIIEKLLENAQIGFKINYDCSLSLINLILCDKMIHDHYELKARMKPLSLQTFVYHWFLTRLGNSKLTRLFITDFFTSILLEKQRRFKIFIDLIGVESFEILQKSQKPIKNQTFYRVNTIKSSGIEEKKPVLSSNLLFIRSPQACKLVIKAMYLIKFSAMRTIDKFSPLFPMLDIELNNLPFELILAVFKQILKEEEFNEESIEESSTLLFNQFLNNELFTKNANTSPGLFERVKANLLEKTLVNIDFFLTFLIEFFAIKFKQKIDGILKVLEMGSFNRKEGENVSLDDFRKAFGKFYPKRNRNWCDRVFTLFCIKNLGITAANLQEMLHNVSSELLQIETVCSPLKEKRPSIEFLQEKGNRTSKKTKNVVELEKIVINNSLKKNNSLCRIVSKREIEEDNSFKYDNYDIVNDLIVLNEFYHLVYGLILKEEMKNEGLFINHQVFKKELMKLPSLKLFQNAKVYSNLMGEWDRREIVERMEKMWGLFRMIFAGITIEN